MKNQSLSKLFRFMLFMHSRRNMLFEEFNKQNEFHDLMNKEKISTLFQPILNLEEGTTLGFEVLNRPQSTQLFPDTETFYDYVSSSSEVFMFETFLRDLSFERFANQVHCLKKHKDQLLFLNIQSQVLADPSYRVGITLELLEKHNLSPYQIVLEITEKEAVINYKQFLRAIDHYRNQGFRIAVDDVGTGYNSLQTLMYVKPEFIKMDKFLIRNIDRHTEQQHLVELLVEFAQQSETEIIAEGIEKTAELHFLQKIGVHLGQGYALGMPNPNLRNGTFSPFPNFMKRKHLL